MRRFSPRAACLAVGLIVPVPGSAQILGASPAAKIVVPSAAAGSAWSGAPAFRLDLPAASLQADLMPVLSPSGALIPAAALIPAVALSAPAAQDKPVVNALAALQAGAKAAAGGEGRDQAPALRAAFDGALDPACPFCGMGDDVFAGNADFQVKPTYGMMNVEGYTLLIPRKHVRAFVALTAADHGRFVEARSEVARGIAKVYGKPVVFEHGVTGQSVYHAHLHFIPGVSVDSLAKEAERLLCRGNEPCALVKEEIAAGSELEKKAAVLESVGGYLYIADPFSGRAVLFHVAPDPSLKMILRQAAANMLGSPAMSDWRKSRDTPEGKLADDAIRASTIAKLKPVIRL